MENQANLNDLRRIVSDLSNQVAHLTVIIEDIHKRLPPSRETPTSAVDKTGTGQCLYEKLASSQRTAKRSSPYQDIDLIPKTKQAFSPSPEPLSELFNKFFESGVLHPIPPTPLPAISPNHNPNFPPTLPQKPNSINQLKTQPPKPKRQYHRLPGSLSSIFQQLLEKQVIKPLEPYELPKELPPTHNPNAFCAYHQMPGHCTNNCNRLRSKIQDLIDNGTIPPPSWEPRIDIDWS